MKYVGMLTHSCQSPPGDPSLAIVLGKLGLINYHLRGISHTLRGNWSSYLPLPHCKLSTLSSMDMFYKISPTGPPGRYQTDLSPTVYEAISLLCGVLRIPWGIFPGYVGKLIDMCKGSSLICFCFQANHWPKNQIKKHPKTSSLLTES